MTVPAHSSADILAGIGDPAARRVESTLPLPRCVVFFGHHKCASRLFRLSIFTHLAQIAGARTRRYEIKVAPFHFSRLDDLDLCNMDFSDLGGTAHDVVLFSNATARSLATVRRSASNWKGVRVIRDPRQVLASDYFHHKGDHPTEAKWVWDTLVRDQPILRELPTEEGLLYELDNITKEVIETQLLADFDDHRVLTIRLEDFAREPQVHLARIGDFLGAPDMAAIDISSTYANPASEPWSNVFTPLIREVFKERYGQALIDMGYERDFDW